MLALAALLGSAAPVESATVDAVTWPTYLRTAPDRHAVVIGELQRGKPVVVEDCTRDWCRVAVDGVQGYLDRRNVAPAAPATDYRAADDAQCFGARRAGYGPGQPLEICPRAGASTTLPPQR